MKVGRMHTQDGWLGLLTLDVLSNIALAVGIALLVLPVALHLWLGADNDSYLVIAEGARRDPVTLVQVGLEWMFRTEGLAVAAVVTIAGVVIKGLVWRRVQGLSRAAFAEMP
jgi:hypothetical protein